MREILDRTPLVLVSLSDAAYVRAQCSHVSIHRGPRFRTWLTGLFNPRRQSSVIACMEEKSRKRLLTITRQLANMDVFGGLAGSN